MDLLSLTGPGEGGRLPPELEYVFIGKWLGIDPEVVRDWDESTAEDVQLVMEALAASRRGL